MSKKLEELTKLLEKDRIEEKRLSTAYDKNFNRFHSMFELYKKKVGWNYVWSNRMITDKHYRSERDAHNRKLLSVIQTMKDQDYFDSIKKEKILYIGLKRIRSHIKKLLIRIDKVNKKIRRNKEFEKRHIRAEKIEQKQKEKIFSNKNKENNFLVEKVDKN